MNDQTQIDTANVIAIPEPPDHTMIRSHVAMIHNLAKGANVEGILTFTRIDATNNTKTERFAIGDVDHMADAIIGWSTHPNLNLYMSHVIFRKDLPSGAAGGEADVRAVLSLVGDLDSDIGKTAVALDALPLQAPYVVETSSGNFHATFPLGRALSVSDAKPIAIKLCDAIGGDSGTKDVSHLWRIPGTLNWPSQKKLERNRSATPQLVTVKQTWGGQTIEPEALLQVVKDAKPSTQPIISKNTKIDWTKVNEHAGWLRDADDLPKDFSTKGRMIVAHTGNIKDLIFDLKEAGLCVSYPSWSEVGIALAAILKNDGRFTNEQIAAALMCDLPCNRHVNNIPKEFDRRRSIERSIARSHTPAPEKLKRIEGVPEWRECLANGKPKPSMHNARLAIAALGIVCSMDTFHNKTLFGYAGDKVRHELQSIVGEVSDDGIIALRLLMSDRFGFDLEDKATRDAVKSLALQHRFNPVCDEIDRAEAEWDGVKRLDRMAAEYFNCEDTTLNAAFIRKTMIGLVARARVPGIKFDTITVLESPEGFNKSTAWKVLASDENYSDERILGSNAREVQEQLSEIWIHENADLAGLKKTEVESVKAYASRQTDIARAAFAHFVVKQKRHSIEVGTTNSSEYLQSQTGNRRFWPMTVLKPIDIAKLAADRLQLIGEAASYHTGGESVVLDEALWGDAGIEQEQRRTKDPWEGLLEHIPMWWDTIEGYDDDHRPVKKAVLVIHLVDDQEVVSAATILKHLLEIPIGHQTPATTMRLSTVMKQLGWQRHKNGYVSINRERVKGYFRDPPLPTAAATLANDARFHPKALSDLSEPEVARA
jgi:Virulence-associated protein E/RepB DNA-primase from phage plasmid